MSLINRRIDFSILVKLCNGPGMGLVYLDARGAVNNLIRIESSVFSATR